MQPTEPYATQCQSMTPPLLAVSPMPVVTREDHGPEPTDTSDDDWHARRADPDGQDGPAHLLKRLASTGVEGDINADGVLDTLDLREMLIAVGTDDVFSDFTGDGVVDPSDIDLLFRLLSKQPGAQPITVTR